MLNIRHRIVYATMAGAYGAICFNTPEIVVYVVLASAHLLLALSRE
ncbi:MAG: hypothetical protein AAFY31_07195 [Pseudomonadota bacterium]